jgi:hypothetical protein
VRLVGLRPGARPGDHRLPADAVQDLPLTCRARARDRARNRRVNSDTGFRTWGLGTGTWPTRCARTRSGARGSGLGTRRNGVISKSFIVRASCPSPEPSGPCP